MALFKHWEENISEGDIEYIPDVTTDIERSMNAFFLNEFEEDDDHSAKTEQIVVPPLNPLMLYAISLHKYANNITEMMKVNDTNEVNLHSSFEKGDLKMPEMTNIAMNLKNTNLNFHSKDFLSYSMGHEIHLPELSKGIVKHIITKCIATMFAHIGYETSQQSALDVLVDVLQDFFKKISLHLKVTLEDEKRQLEGFPHAIERVLTELGMGGVKGLDDYYQSRVIKYTNVLENRCKELNDEYQSLLIPKSPSPVDKINKVVRVKVEEEDVVESENPEVHFSTIDGDVNFSILETGYQLLNSLEAEANLQSLGESVEDIAATESPGVVSIPSEDMSHLSPFSKKKRFK